MDPNPFRPPIEEELLSGAELDAASGPKLALRGNRFGAALLDQIAIAFGSFGASFLLGLAFRPSGALSLADVLSIFGSERRCLHDYLAGTKVVEAPR